MLGLVLGLAGPACSGQVSEPAQDDEEASLTGFGARDIDAEPAAPPPRGTDRVRFHGGPLLSAMRLQIVYLGEIGEGGASSRDDVLEGTLQSGGQYWGRLVEYGVGPATILGSQRLTKAAFTTGLDPDGDGLVTILELEERVRTLLHPMRGTSVVPPADAYAFFLPQGLNVSFGNRGSKIWKTCVDVGAYHRFDGQVPYAVFPPCELGQSARAISHELLEMATDPKVGTGWLSDTDLNLGIGEIADLCNREVASPINGLAVTQFWSNKEARCVP